MRHFLFSGPLSELSPGRHGEQQWVEVNAFERLAVETVSISTEH